VISGDVDEAVDGNCEKERLNDERKDEKIWDRIDIAWKRTNRLGLEI
jgi:hypothetical protein